MEQLRERAEKIYNLGKHMQLTFKCSDDKEYMVLAIMAGLLQYQKPQVNVLNDPCDKIEIRRNKTI